jgi:hypothetical protein
VKDHIAALASNVVAAQVAKRSARWMRDTAVQLDDHAELARTAAHI